MPEQGKRKFTFLYMFIQMMSFLPAPIFETKCWKNEKLLGSKVIEYEHFYWETLEL